MLLDKTTIRPWARRNDWQAGERGMLFEMVHDLTYVCEGCAERFTDADDMATDDDGIRTGFCLCCESNGWAPESTLYARNGSVVG
jgi:hypothetical protein